MQLVGLAVALVVASSGLGAAQADAAGSSAAACEGHDLVPGAENLTAIREATLCLVNAERTERGLGELEPVAVLHTVAAAYAKRMVRERFFGHTSPDGGTVVSRVKRTKYLRGGLRRWSLGENLAWGTGQLATPAKVVISWMRSPSHRRNILTARFTELGLGVSTGAPFATGGDRAAATYVNAFGERRR